MTPNIVGEYPGDVAGLDWRPLGSAGGFSGASVWQGRTADGPRLALKCWPHGYPPGRLAEIHGWMHLARDGCGLGFVPRIVRTKAGASLAIADGKVWDVTGWMPGTADFSANPTDARLTSAAAALAALHRTWAPRTTTLAPCPGVGRRLDILRRFRPTFPADPDLRRASSLLPERVAGAVRRLSVRAVRPMPVQPCLCDPWHDHLLFTGDELTGLIDFGAAKPDHPAVDLARMLGDLVGHDPARFAFGIAAYRQAGGPVEVPDEFARLLNETGIVCAVIGWLGRLPDAPPTGPGAERFRRLAGRLEAISFR